MINLANRSYRQEFLDNNNIPFADIRQNMKELNIINTYLGGHKITTAGINKLIFGQTTDKVISICEIGCGGGDNLKAIENYCRKKNIHATYTGIDIKPECIAFANQQYPSLDAKWITSDYRRVNFNNNKPDILSLIHI